MYMADIDSDIKVDLFVPGRKCMIEYRRTRNDTLSVGKLVISVISYRINC